MNPNAATAGGAAARLSRIPPGLWAEIAARASRLLILDFDGTLAPLRVERAEARMPDRVRAALARVLAGGRTQVAIVSGRPLDELCALTEGLPVHRVAEHGWDELTPGGEPVHHPLPPRAEWALSLADDETATHGWTPRIERKRCSRVLHTRGMEPVEATALETSVRAVWQRVATMHGLAVRAMDGGIELRVPGADKGTAVDTLLSRCAPGTFVACLGDDDTDEDAFARVAPIGCAIRVGPMDRPSRANGRLESPDEVADFLRRWDEATSPGDPAGTAPISR